MTWQTNTLRPRPKPKDAPLAIYCPDCMVPTALPVEQALLWRLGLRPIMCICGEILQRGRKDGIECP